MFRTWRRTSHAFRLRRSGWSDRVVLKELPAERTPSVAIFPILFGSIRARDLDVASFAASYHAHAPRIAADLAVLDEAAAHVGLDVDLDLFAAVRAGNQEAIVHLSNR